MERYHHFDLASQAVLPEAQRAERAQEGKGRGLVLVLREDLDDLQREKRAECAGCRYTASCEGVWSNYLKRYGWDELRPVPPEPA